MTQLSRMMDQLDAWHIKPSRTQMLRFGLSLALAILLWGWVTELQDPFSERTFLEMPVVASGLTDDLQIVSELPNATVRMEGPESRVGPVNRTEVAVTMDLSDIDQPGTYDVRVVAAAPNVSEISVTPGELSIQVDRRVSQVFPLTVVPGDRGREGDTTSIENVEPVVSQVTVSGPESRVSRIEQVLLPVTIDQQVQDFDATFEPQAVDANGQRIADVEILPETVLTHVMVESRGKQVSVIPSVTGVPAEGYAVQQRRAIPDTIIVDGPAAVLDTLLFVNTEPVDIGGANESFSTTVGLADLPEGVTVVEPASARVEVRIAIEDTTASSQTVNELPVEVVGLGDGLQAQVDPGVVSIQVNAPVTVLQAMTPADIGVLVDVSDLGPGQHTVELSVTVPQGATWVGSEPGTVVVTILMDGGASPVAGAAPPSPQSAGG